MPSTPTINLAGLKYDLEQGRITEHEYHLFAASPDMARDFGALLLCLPTCKHRGTDLTCTDCNNFKRAQESYAKATNTKGGN